MKILRDRVYRMSQKKLARYFEGRNFRGEVTLAKCTSIARNTKSAIAHVRKDVRAMTIVLVSDLPAKAELEGVRILSIDGKQPGDKGYALVGEPAVAKEPSQ